MGHKRNTKRFPRPQDLDARVYAAFMGHAPEVRPPDEHGPDAWQHWPVLRDLKVPRLERLRKICHESVRLPGMRERVAPLLAQARQRWGEARERLEKAIERPRAARCTPAHERKSWSLK
jgi:hypothetical protein